MAGTTRSAVRYATTVTAVGGLVEAFRADGLLVWFAEGAPEELHEFSLLHAPEVADGGVQVGDTVDLDGHRFTVTAVGDVADTNLRQLGHLDLKANGETVPPLPGDVCVEKAELPVLVAGSRLTITAPGSGTTA